MGRILVNCDIGEHESDVLTAELIPYLDAANICCGVHAGSIEKTRSTIALALAHGCLIGAHPGLANAGGRGDVAISPEAFSQVLEKQLGEFITLLDAQGGLLSYVKLHGALYHAVEKDAALAHAYLTSLSNIGGQIPAVCVLAGGKFSGIAQSAGLHVYEEVFFDRGYQSDGALVSRSNPGAVLSAVQAFSRFTEWHKTGQMETVDGRLVPLHGDTVCVHGDSPEAIQMLQMLQSEFK